MAISFWSPFRRVVSLTVEQEPGPDNGGALFSWPDIYFPRLYPNQGSKVTQTVFLVYVGTDDPSLTDNIYTGEYDVALLNAGANPNGYMSYFVYADTYAKLHLLLDPTKDEDATVEYVSGRTSATIPNSVMSFYYPSPQWETPGYPNNGVWRSINPPLTRLPAQWELYDPDRAWRAEVYKTEAYLSPLPDGYWKVSGGSLKVLASATAESQPTAFTVNYNHQTLGNISTQYSLKNLAGGGYTSQAFFSTVGQSFFYYWP